MRRFVLLSVCLCLLLVFPGSTEAAMPDGTNEWKDKMFNFANVKSVLVLPVTLKVQPTDRFADKKINESVLEQIQRLQRKHTDFTFLTWESLMKKISYEKNIDMMALFNQNEKEFFALVNDYIKLNVHGILSPRLIAMENVKKTTSAGYNYEYPNIFKPPVLVYEPPKEYLALNLGLEFELSLPNQQPIWAYSIVVSENEPTEKLFENLVSKSLKRFEDILKSR